MDLLVLGGAAALGVLIGISVGFFIHEAKAMNFKVLSGAVYIVGGAVVLGLFHFLSNQLGAVREYWAYPIGLLADLSSP